MAYERFRIEKKPAPPRHPQPYPFDPRVSKARLALMLIREASEYGFKLLTDTRYRKLLLSRPCIYGVFDGWFAGFKPIKERCTGCMRCVQEFPDIVKVNRNPEYYSFGDSYWVSNDPYATPSTPLATVWYEAATGKIPVKGMGYRGSFAASGWDSMWTDMSEIVRPTRDGVYGREFISTVVDVGRKPRFLKLEDSYPLDGSRVVQVPVPIIFDYLPLDLSSLSIRASIAQAARRLGTFFMASPDYDFNSLGDSLGHMIPLLSSDTLKGNEEAVLKAKVVEYVHDGTAAYKRIRDLNPNALLSIRLPFNRHVEDEASRLAGEGVEIIHLCANYHGRECEGEDPRFVRDMIRSVHTRLVKDALRDEITIIVSGGVILAEHVPKAIICGADVVAVDTTIPIALQAKFDRECVSPDDGRIEPDRFDVEWGAQRLVNLVGSWHDQLIEVLSAMGMRDVRRLRGDVGRAMFNEDLEREAFGDLYERR